MKTQLNPYTFLQIICVHTNMYVCMYEQELAFDIPERLICHKTQSNQTVNILIFNVLLTVYFFFLAGGSCFFFPKPFRAKALSIFEQFHLVIDIESLTYYQMPIHLIS